MIPGFPICGVELIHGSTLAREMCWPCKNILPQKRWSTNGWFVSLANISLDCIWHFRNMTEYIWHRCEAQRVATTELVCCMGARPATMKFCCPTCLHVWREYEVSLLWDVCFVLDADHAGGDVHVREVDARTRKSINTIFFGTTMNLRYMNGRKFMPKYWKINALGCWWSHSLCRKHRSALRPKKNAVKVCFALFVACCAHGRPWFLGSQNCYIARHYPPMIDHPQTFPAYDHFRVKY